MPRPKTRGFMGKDLASAKGHGLKRCGMEHPDRAFRFPEWQRACDADAGLMISGAARAAQCPSSSASFTGSRRVPCSRTNKWRHSSIVRAHAGILIIVDIHSFPCALSVVPLHLLSHCLLGSIT